MHPFDWKNPNYDETERQRLTALFRIEQDPSLLPALRAYYADHPIQFIQDWGMTTDPRAAGNAKRPFVLFPRQVEMLQFILDRHAANEPGLVAKSRDCGASWLTVELACTLCLFRPHIAIGFGSAKQDKVDNAGDINSLFGKARFFLNNIPPVFRGGWEERKHSKVCLITFPGTDSHMFGQGGDNIGRGDRATLFFIDESAHVEHPDVIDAALAATTNCRIDISSVNGMANSFAQKRFAYPPHRVFTFSWREDPRKDDAWYEDQKTQLDPVTLAQEVDIDWRASTEGALIPTAWVQSAIGAAQKLGIEELSGIRIAALDVADTGRDLNAFVGRTGPQLTHAQTWSGKDRDIYHSVERTFMLCDDLGYRHLRFDADGLGSGVRGDARKLNEARRDPLLVEGYRGSAEVADKDGSLVEGRLNKDHFANLKAQAWWSLRNRFQATHRAVSEKLPYDPNAIISIDPKLLQLSALISELSQPTYRLNALGKKVIDKSPDGMASPNLADAVCMAFCPYSNANYFVESVVVSREDPKAKLPEYNQYAFGVIGFTADAVGVVYFVRLFNDQGGGLAVVDYDLREITPDMVHVWVPAIFARLKEISQTYRTLDREGQSKMFVDSEAIGLVLHEHAYEKGYLIHLIGDDVPPAEERHLAASAYVGTGSVRFVNEASAREITYRGATRNFLLDQARVADSGALSVAFASGVLISERGR
jgi:phage terminase large subunit